jgi:uncharacterized protein YsxB (DUF464 family)
MTKYKITQSDQSYRIEVLGHANYQDEGYDIVCAGISMAVAMTANLLDKLSLSCNIIELTHDKGKFILEVDMKNDTAIKVLDNLVDCLSTLEKQYPSNLKKLK